MDQFLLHLRILNNILEKKLEMLNQVYNITQNQQSVCSAQPDGGILELYKGMIDEKQKLIDEINISDKIFEKTYREIGAVFEAEAPKHAGLIKRMQEGIKRVTALDTRIRVLEARNGSPRGNSAKVKDNALSRKRAARIYTGEH